MDEPGVEEEGGDGDARRTDPGDGGSVGGAGADPPPADGLLDPTPDDSREAAPSEPVARVLGQIVVDGNRRVSDSAFFNNLRLKTGDPYDERAIFDEFRRLWNLNLFDDISVESRRRASG
ncbi:MAG: hypothetical protein O7A63_07055, partial [Acidobacteria bacterium]|nr:hypothetical protein [Acidobacteriota bacterium]